MGLFVLAAALVAASVLLGGASAGGAAAPRTIVYWSESPWPSIWTIRADGSHDRRILRNRQNAKRPRLSPDGRLVAFDGAPPGKPPLTDFDVQVVRLDGRGRRTLTSGRAWDIDAAWSPDGSTLSFTRLPPSPQGCAQGSIWIVRGDGTGARRVAAGCSARWSPDGRRLVYASPSSGVLLTASLDGSRVRTVARVAAGEAVQPVAWVGGAILFDRLSSDGRSSTVYRVPAAGGRPRKVVDGFAGAVARDGRILLADGWPGRLTIVDARGRRLRRLPAVGHDPDWR